MLTLQDIHVLLPGIWEYAAWAQEGQKEIFQFKARKGSGEEIPLVQGKEQRLRFAGAAVKKYPMSMVRETQVKL